jgi:hypothetical protein
MRRLAILACIPLLLAAQPEFFGYFESEVDVLQLNNESYSFAYNKLRLGLESRPNEHVLIGANIIAQHYSGQTTWNIFDFIPNFTNLGLELPLTIPDTLLLDNAYMRLNFSWADITLGRQQISPGVGYAWNPTDIFNSKTLLDPSYEQTGVPGIRLDAPLFSSLSLSTFIQPEDDWEKTAKQLWLKSNIWGFDIELTTAQNQWPYWTSLSSLPPVDRRLYGASIVGEIAGVGVWTESARYTMDGIDTHGTFNHLWDEVVWGADYTFENSFYVLGEVLFNGLGEVNKRNVQLNNYFQSLEGITRGLMQNYTFVYMSHPTFDYVSLSLLSIACLNDYSGTLAPQIDWNAFENTNISFQGSFFFGEDDTEFGIQDWGLRLRVRSDF